MTKKLPKELTEKITKAKICKASGLTPATLQHWRECGVLSTSKGEENGYNYFNVFDLLVIQNVLSYRNINCSLKEIKTIDTLSKSQFIEFLVDKDQRIDDEIARLKNQQAVLRQTLEIARYDEEIVKLKIFEEDPHFTYVYKIDINNDAVINQIIHSMCRMITFVPLNNSVADNAKYGIGTVNKIPRCSLIWQKNNTNKFFACVFESTEAIGNSQFSVDIDNENRILEEIKTMGFVPLNLFYSTVFIYSKDNHQVSVTKLYIECK